MRMHSKATRGREGDLARATAKTVSARITPIGRRVPVADQLLRTKNPRSSMIERKKRTQFTKSRRSARVLKFTARTTRRGRGRAKKAGTSRRENGLKWHKPPQLTTMRPVLNKTSS